MKIAYFCSRYLPRFKGGTESLTRLLARGEQARGHEVRVVTVESTEAAAGSEISGCDDSYEGVPVHRISYNWSAQPSPFRALTTNPAMEDYLVRWLEKEKPEVVHVTNCFRITSAALTAPRKLGISTVMTLTEFWFFCPIGSSFNVAGEICPGAEQVRITDCLTCYVGLGQTFKRLPFGNRIPPHWVAVALAAMDRGDVSRQAVPARFAGCTQALEDRKALMRDLRGGADMFLTLNDWEKEYYVERGFDPNRITTVIPAVEPVSDSALNEKPRHGRIRVGFIGAMVRYKGIETLIEGFRSADLGARAALDLWGDDQSDPDFRRQLVGLIGGSPDIHLRGRFAEGRLHEIFSEMDLMAIPSLSLETGPLVLFEAFAHHTPVLCSNHGGMPQYVREGINGLLFEPGNSPDCARALRRIAQDDSILDRMKANARQPKTLDQFLGEHEDVYRRLHGSQRVRGVA